MLMTEYETTVVLRPELGGDAVEVTLDRMREVVKTNGGKLIAINHWGKKKLAYEIAKHGRGIYVHAQYLGIKGLVAELERNLRISDNVVRYMTIKVAGDVDPATREEKQYVKPQYDVEEVSERDEAAPAAFEEGDEPVRRGADDEDEAEEDTEVEAAKRD